jgi:hypothetical protein
MKSFALLSGGSYMHRRWHIFLALLWILAFALSSYKSADIHYNSPDEKINYIFASQYAESGHLYIDTEDDPYINYSRIRGTKVLDDRVVPLKFLGLPWLLGSWGMLTPGIIHLITSLLASIAVLAIVLITLEVTANRRTAGVAGILFVFFPFFWYWSNHPLYENVAALSFYLLGLLYLIKFAKNESRPLVYGIVAVIFFAISITVRYDLAIAIIVTTIPFLLMLKKRHYSVSAAVLAVGVLFLIPTLILSSIVYGNILSYGLKVQTADNNETAQAPPKLWKNIALYYEDVLAALPYLLISLAVALCLLLYPINPLPKLLAMSFILLLVVFSYIYVAEYPPTHPNVYHESYTRYALPLFSLAIILVAIATETWRWDVLSAALGVYIILSIVLVLPFLTSQWKLVADNSIMTDRVVSQTSESDFIFVTGEDKFIYPDRKVIPINNIKAADAIDYGKVAELSYEISLNNSAFYLGRYMEIATINASLSSYNLTLTLVDRSLLLYKAEALNSGAGNET